MIAVMLSVVFGIGWGIGLLATEELGSKAARDFFASLFVIITSFHGLLIFILHCVRSKDARREWRRWFFKATKKEFTDFTSSTFGYIQHNLKTSSLRPLSLSSSSKTTKKFELHSSTASPFFSMTGDGRTLKLNVMKQRELDTLSNFQSVEEGTYDLAMEPELDTHFTKVDLAKMEAKQERKSEVSSLAKSTTQQDNILLEVPFAITVTLSDPEEGESKLNQLSLQDEAEKMEPKEVQQGEEQSLEQPIPNDLKEPQYAEDATSVTNSSMEMESKEVWQDEQSLEEPIPDKLNEPQYVEDDTSVTNSALEMKPKEGQQDEEQGLEERILDELIPNKLKEPQDAADETSVTISALEMEPKGVQREKEQSPEEPIPNQLKDPPYAEGETPLSNSALELEPKELHQDEERSLDEPMSNKLKEAPYPKDETSVTNSALEKEPKEEVHQGEEQSLEVVVPLLVPFPRLKW